MGSLCFIAYNLFFVRSTLQLSSHNWPRDIKDVLRKCGKTMAVRDCSDTLSEKVIFPWCVTAIKSLFGNRMEGPGNARYFKCSMCLVCVNNCDSRRCRLWLFLLFF